MALVPFNRQDKLAYKPFTNLLDDFFGDSWRPVRGPLADTFKLDVREELLHYTVEAELPGVKKEEVGVDFHDGRLTVSVTCTEQSDEEKAKYIHRERRTSSAQRSIYLAGATGNGISAALADGVLHITVPKEDEQRKTKIEIK